MSNGTFTAFESFSKSVVFDGYSTFEKALDDAMRFIDEAKKDGYTIGSVAIRPSYTKEEVYAIDLDFFKKGTKELAIVE